MYRASVAIDTEYEHVKSLPRHERLDFFWSVMLHVKLDASFVTDFHMLILADSGDEFIGRLEKFLADSSARGIYERNQQIAERTLGSLRKMQAYAKLNTPRDSQE